MTPDQLTMHKRLQPLYKRVMGSWLQGDNFVSFPELDDILTCDEAYLGHPVSRDGFRYPKAIFIPLTIDTENPERGLWGMLDWSKWNYEQCGPDGEIAIYKLPFISYCEELGIPIKDHPFATGDLTTAILKALCEQEGV